MRLWLVVLAVLVVPGWTRTSNDLRSVDDDSDSSEEEDPTTPQPHSRREHQQAMEGLQLDFITHASVLWDRFKTKYARVYDTINDERHRFSVFLQNLRFISDHNQEYSRGNRSHRVSINQLADLTPAEYRQLNGFKRNFGDTLARPHAASYLSPFHVSVPVALDWRTQGYVSEVKNQGMCGSCWAFSATGALEGQHKRKTGNLTTLSEQNLVDCSTSYGNHGCQGGLMDQAFQYIKDNQGIDTEKGYPYEAKDGKCRFQKKTIGAVDSGFVDLPSGDETKLKEGLATVGPISIAIDASHQSFQFYDGDVYIEPECKPDQLDHGVLAVGYGTDAKGQDFWIVKNSWGPKWGEKGYIRMARNKQNQCGVATVASYPLV